MNDSILLTIKKLLGIDKNYNVFDSDIVIHINSVFMILCQLGVGPDKPFSIEGESETWSQFSPDTSLYQLVKSYIYLKVRLIFDPPSTGVLHQAVERQISEFEWRLNVQGEELNKESDGDKNNSEDNNLEDNEPYFFDPFDDYWEG